MPDAGDLLISLTGVEKDYRGLRPLRIRTLTLHEREIVALLGFDQASAEVLVNLIAGATLPDIGEVRIFGRLTTEIADADAWLKALDEFGIITERAVLLDELTVEQNLAVPLSLELHDLPAALRAQVAQLAVDAGIDAERLPQRAGTLAPLDRMRVRLARAVAGAPRVLMAEHPNAALPSDDLPTFAADLARVISIRRLACLILTADRVFARAVATQVLIFNAATGDLTRAAGGWGRRWFS
jgi:putative ABC transport system ATP-binding protein